MSELCRLVADQRETHRYHKGTRELGLKHTRIAWREIDSYHNGVILTAIGQGALIREGPLLDMY